VLLLVQKRLADLDVRKERALVKTFDPARLFVLARLLQIDAVARAIERDLALLAAALRTDASVNRGAEALFFAEIADGAGQVLAPDFIMACVSGVRLQASGVSKSHGARASSPA